ncbi:glycosyltransferase [Candidatus Woesearchaeota archaeon]|nr:glycosyltransferase [Candidatus Woesearchaeota archaeon]
MSISLCMIAKDEEQYIEQCLKSAKPLVDEIIITLADDSKDRTEDIARKYGARIIRHKWNNDFSEERNIGLEQASGEWVLVLDADEVLAQKDLDKIRKITENKEIAGAYFLQRNYLEDESRPGFNPNRAAYSEEKGKGYADNQILRLFRNEKDIRFSFRLHETVEPSIKNAGRHVLATDIPIHHYGFLRGEEQIRLKRERCIRLGEEQIKQNPEDPRHYYELALIYLNMKDNEKARELFEKARSLKKDYKDVNNNLGLICLRRKELDKAEQYFRDDLRLNQRSRSMTNLAVLMLRKKQVAEAFEMLKKALKADPKDLAAMKNIAVILATAKKYQEAEKILQRAGQLAPKDPSVFFNMGMLYANQGKKAEALQALQKAESLGHRNRQAIRQMVEKLQG